MSSSSSRMMWEIDQQEEELFNQSERMFNLQIAKMRWKRMRSVEGKMTKQEWPEPHIPVESSRLLLRYASPTVQETLIEAGNDGVKSCWTITLSITVHFLIRTSDTVLE
ncbi:hypothetical protein ACFX1Z_016434 [Malus domestica]